MGARRHAAVDPGLHHEDKYRSQEDAEARDQTVVEADSRVSAVAFVQNEETGVPPRRRVRDFLLSQGQRIHSQRSGLLAEKLAADPFAKVEQLIDSTITRLLEPQMARCSGNYRSDLELLLFLVGTSLTEVPMRFSN